jgi:hypothetical protein
MGRFVKIGKVFMLQADWHIKIQRRWRMKIRYLLSLTLLAILSAGCAPATSTATAAPVRTAEPSQTPSPVPTVEQTATSMLELPSATQPVDARPVATSRGPNLEATDPTTVNLASDGLQLVEFFRFT